MAQAARAAGVPVEHRAGLGGTRLVWNALETGEIDVYPEYTGTIVEEILSAERPAAGSPSETWLREHLAARGLVLSAPLGFDNGYALAMPEGLAGRLGVRSVSDLRRHPALRLGFSSEFMNRREGGRACASATACPTARCVGWSTISLTGDSHRGPRRDRRLHHRSPDPPARAAPLAR